MCGISCSSSGGDWSTNVLRLSSSNRLCDCSSVSTPGCDELNGSMDSTRFLRGVRRSKSWFRMNSVIFPELKRCLAVVLTMRGSTREPSASFLGGDRGAERMGLKWLNSPSMELLLPALWLLSRVTVAAGISRNRPSPTLRTKTGRQCVRSDRFRNRHTSKNLYQIYWPGWGGYIRRLQDWGVPLYEKNPGWFHPVFRKISPPHKSIEHLCSVIRCQKALKPPKFAAPYPPKNIFRFAQLIRSFKFPLSLISFTAFVPIFTPTEQRPFFWKRNYRPPCLTQTNASRGPVLLLLRLNWFSLPGDGVWNSCSASFSSWEKNL